jgi:hypothetical protein
VLTYEFVSSLSAHLERWEGQGGLAGASPGLVKTSPIVRSRADARMHALLQVEPTIESLEPLQTSSKSFSLNISSFILCLAPERGLIAKLKCLSKARPPYRQRVLPVTVPAVLQIQMKTGPRSRIRLIVGGFRTELPKGTTVSK